ncbi:hypothetical protein BHF71_07335 [Vulcanibacillus modesticaldus]|uniref:DUF1848 domain-containing protein n=1 Tax=Vulcanibacillus modesticaldus TaxID=337097 RepID=A0A1D2YW62_9BACI|nr:DUF1848 domain-containing protein [Vulcanibacillus modesticaldus]OEF99913.1 hypothetical protein BHF71_07335 [Vulcanibacillus modesticaldus]
MIISASRRTDIPAFYSDWFFNRIKEGYVLVRNPYNYHHVSKVKLTPDVVDMIVFWTKNPTKMLNKLDLLKEYNYYFQFTLNSYDKSIEKNVPKKSEVITTFIKLSEKIGKNRVIWRYDPIFLTDQIDKKYHYEYFAYLANRLKNHTNKVVISFLSLYKKTERNTKHLNIKQINEDDIRDIALKIAKIARMHNLTIEACSEPLDLSEVGIDRGHCIDRELITDLLGVQIAANKDKNQRNSCGCITSIDIGTYNSCDHQCLYCYANFNRETVIKNRHFHHKNSPLLLGKLEKEDQVYERDTESLKHNQLSLFDF